MKVQDLHKIDKPREKLEKYGAGKLSNEELLAILLRTGPEGTGVLTSKNSIMSLERFIYNPKYYDGVNLRQIIPRKLAFKKYQTKDGTLIGLFQGNRGERPEIDFVVKILIPGYDKKLRPPTHTFWIVDLLLKIPEHKDEVREVVQFYIEYYNRTTPFSSIEERNNYQLETLSEITTRYAYLEQEYTLSLDYVAIIIELFCKNEKRTNGAYMFRDLLLVLRDYIDGNKHYTEVLQAAQPGFR